MFVAFVAKQGERVVTVIFHSENLSFNENLVSRFIRSVFLFTMKKNIVRTNNFSSRKRHVKSISKVLKENVSFTLCYSHSFFSDSQFYPLIDHESSNN